MTKGPPVGRKGATPSAQSPHVFEYYGAVGCDLPLHHRPGQRRQRGGPHLEGRRGDHALARNKAPSLLARGVARVPLHGTPVDQSIEP